jgi:hypothetical protein
MSKDQNSNLPPPPASEATRAMQDVNKQINEARKRVASEQHKVARGDKMEVARGDKMTGSVPPTLTGIKPEKEPSSED